MDEEKFWVVPAHTLLFTEMLTVGVTLALIWAVMVEAVAVVEVLQVALLVSTKPITSPLLKVLEEYVEAVAPEILLPLRVHWYAGEAPPLVMDEVKFWAVPAQTLLEFTEMLTVGVTLALIWAVMVEAVAVLEVLQVALLVKTKPITSPLLKELEE